VDGHQNRNCLTLDFWKGAETITSMVFLRSLIALNAILLSLAFSGCETSSATLSTKENPRPPVGNVSHLRAGDTIIVTLQSIPDAAQFQFQIDDQGDIRLRYIGNLKAAGKSPSILAEEITTSYIEGDIYRSIDVSVDLTERLVYVGGEVKRPGPIQWSPDMTLSKAITAAGGFTLYAKESGVLLSREKQSYVLSVSLAKDKPSEDITILPGDSLNVPRSAF